MNAQKIRLYAKFVANVIILMGGKAYICEILQYLKIDRRLIAPKPDLLVANDIIDQNLPAILARTRNDNWNLRQQSEFCGTYLEDTVTHNSSINFLGYKFLVILTRDGASMLDSTQIRNELMELFDHEEIVFYFRYLEQNGIITVSGDKYFLTDGFGQG